MFNEVFSHNSVKFDYDGKDNMYMSIEDYVLNNKISPETVNKVMGVWINPKSKHGARGVVVLEGININVPAHMNKDIETIRENADLVSGINAGKCGIRFYTYEKDGKTYYSGRFCDYE